MRLEITLAGDVTVGRDGGEPQPLSGPSRVVLAALALAGDAAVPRDDLAGMVWPEAMPRTWASALRTHVSRVRSLVSAVVGSGETVTSGESGYQLALPAGVTLDVDVRRAEHDLDGARRLAATDPAEALRLASRAADAARPPFLAGHPGRWAEDVRAHLDAVVLEALELASRAAVEVGDTARAIALADDAVRRGPLRESAHRTLMTALGAAGNRADALRAYQRLRRVLADEMGVDPSPETESAYLDLLGPTPPPRAAATLGAGDAAGPAVPPGHTSAAVPFVGRQFELAELAAAWEHAVGGARHLVVITGEAGIGKSRLATEAARAAHADGGLVLFGRCDQEAIVPYQPIVEALDGLVAATPPDELPFLGDDAMAELGTVLPSLARPRRAGGADRARLFAAVTELVARVAKERPLLLVLDDLQWADDDTLLLVRHLLRRAGDAPLLAIAISRDHDLSPGHALAGVVHSLDRDGWARRLPLRGLDEGDVRELLHHLHGPGDHGLAARRLVDETAGNPYLVTELVRAGGAAGGGAGRATGGASNAGSAAGAVAGGVADPGAEIPPGVHDLVTTRLARLADPTVDLLKAGAVAGARFDLDIAGDAAGLSDDGLVDAADEALASGLVVEETPDRYRFPHDIVRRTLVAQLSGARRRWLHRRTADAIERRRPHDLEAHAAVLAHHASAGADPAGDPRAVAWARRASTRAAQRSAPAEAARLCRQALAHLPTGHDGERAEITTDLGVALLAGGDPAGPRTLREGAALARRHERPDVLGRAALALADAADERPELRAEARELVADALAAAWAEATGAGDPAPPAAATGDPAADGVADALAAAPAEATGGAGGVADLDLARLLVRRLRLADPDEPLAAAARADRPPAGALRALHRGVQRLADPRRIDERQRLADELADLADVADDPEFRALAAHEQAMAAAALGDEATMRAALDRMSSAAADDPLVVARLAERTVARLVIDGGLDEARAALETARRAATAAGAAEAVDPAGLDAPDAVAARHTPVLDWLVGAATPTVELPAGDVAAAQHLHDLGLAALAACEGDDPDAIAEVRARLAPYADLICGVGYRSFVGAAPFHLGRLAAAAGDLADAERHLLAALRIHSAWRARPWVALTQDALAGVLEARGRPSDREWIAGLRSEARWVASTLGLRSL